MSYTRNTTYYKIFHIFLLVDWSTNLQQCCNNVYNLRRHVGIFMTYLSTKILPDINDNLHSTILNLNLLHIDNDL